MFARQALPVRTIPVKTHFGATQIPADKYYQGGKVHYRFAWDRSIETARIVLSFDRPRHGSDTPTKGTRVRVRVEIGSGSMTQCLGETFTEWRGKNHMYIWMSDYARLKGLQ